MSLQAIRGALNARLKTLGWEDQTAWEGRKFTPDPTQPYQRVAVIFAEPNSYSLGDDAQEQGIYQITLCFPLAEVAAGGIGATTARAEAIRAAFPKNDWVGGVAKIMRRAEITRLGPEGDRDITVIRIRFSDL